MLTIRGAQGGGGLQHVELSWSVGTSSSLALIQASNDGSTWPLVGLGQSGPSSILEDNVIAFVGQLYPATGLATRMVISSIISRAAFLERLARGMIGAEVGTDPLWCTMLGGAEGAELEMVPMERESEHRAWLSSTCRVGRAGPSALNLTSADGGCAMELMVETPFSKELAGDGLCSSSSWAHQAGALQCQRRGEQAEARP